ncbi:MAG: accessory Sec system protein Asp3 [Lachnospiraceae bacterium]|nr:accessory Sec system protein Asp3 [Lachnospiraceae bacterium]
MADSAAYMIRWDSCSANPYLYGSSVRYMPDGSVRFENELMPSGYVINEWSSDTNFQRDRHEPQLPILWEECSYTFRAYYSEKPAHTVFLRVDFYDHQGSGLGYQIFDKKMGSFRVPKGMFRYTMQLVSGGMKKVNFYGMELFAGEKRIFGGVCNQRDDVDELNIIIPEMRGRMAYVPESILAEKLPNAFAISPCMRILPVKTQADVMKRLTNGYREVNFRINGNEERQLAVTLAKRIEDSHIRKRLYRYE